jgi:hypothetical protein
MAFFDITLKTVASLHSAGEPSDFISEYTGFIRSCRDRNGKITRVGKIHAYRIHADLAANHGASLFDVCDAHSQELHFVQTLLYEPDHYGFRSRIMDRFDAVEADCLVLDYIVLHPKWRRLKLGLLAVRKLVDLLGGGCGLTVSYFAPLNPHAHALLKVPRSWIPEHQDQEARKEAVGKLRRYFRRMGFERIARSPYFALPMARLTPSAEDLLKPQRRPEDRQLR